MPYDYMDIARTPGVEKVQAELGVDHLWRNYRGNRTSDRFTESELAYIAERDTFYMATVSQTGWPYVQHRGGPRGFLKTVDDKTLAFADYSGNRQYLSLGNLATDDRVSLILMDYPRRARLKILGHMQALALDVDPALTERVTDPAYGAKLERILVVKLQAFDWNCPKYIVPRYTELEINEALAPMRERLDQLATENADLRARLASSLA